VMLALGATFVVLGGGRLVVLVTLVMLGGGRLVMLAFGGGRLVMFCVIVRRGMLVLGPRRSAEAEEADKREHHDQTDTLCLHGPRG